MRDPAFYLGLIFLFFTIQVFVWIIGRFSLELDLWRTAPFAFVLLYAKPVLTATGVTLTSIILSFVIPALIVWAMAGFFYEPDLRQRIAMSTVLPVLGMVALPLGFYLRKVIFSY